jgi:xylulokinase
MSGLILARDLGTTGNKTPLFDVEGHLLDSAFEGYPTDYPYPGWAEQDPADWWRAVSHSMRRVLAESSRAGKDVSVISFSGEMISCLPVDAGDLPLRKALIWADQRAEAEASWMVGRLGVAEGYRITGHRLSASYTAAKLLWVRAHQPDLYARTAKVLRAKDYTAWMLTGVFATDYSDASGSNLVGRDPLSTGACAGTSARRSPRPRSSAG